VPPELREALRRGPARTRLPAAPVTLPFVADRTQPAVDVAVNGTGPYRFLVDLGGNVNLLHARHVEATGARLLHQGSRLALVGVETLGLGEAALEDVVLTTDPALDFDGLLGMNAFREGLVTLDYPAATLTLARGALPPAGEGEGGSDVHDYQLLERMPYLEGRHVTARGTRAFPVNFDTGARGWLVLPQAWEAELAWARPPVPGPMAWNNQSGERRSRVGRLAGELRIGPLVLREPVVVLDPEFDDAVMGSALLRPFRLTFDPAHRRVRMEREGDGPLEVPPVPTFGVGLAREAGGGWRVSDVVPGTPAEALGVRAGDRLVSLNGSSLEGFGPERWRALLAEAERVTLGLRGADGAVRTVELPRVLLGA
jgi:hypothetical protein